MIAPIHPNMLPVIQNQPAPGQAAEQPVLPPQEFLDELRAHSERLETATPFQVLEWAVEKYYPKLTMATAFGPEGCVILWMLSQINKDVHVFNLDTGYQFQETLDLRNEIALRYGIEVELTQPDTTVAEYEALHGGRFIKRILISAVPTARLAF